jgi:hypothetical protein
MNALSRTLAVATLLAATGFAGNASAALNCKPDVKVVNNKPASIKVLKFKYRTELGGSAVFTESLNNRKLAANGDDETWKSQKLSDAATGIVVTETAVEYKDDNSGAGDGYGPAKTSPWFKHSFTCGDNHTYIQTIE